MTERQSIDTEGEASPGGAETRPFAIDAVIIILLMAACLAVRLLTLEMPELGGDAFKKWHFVRQWFFDNDISEVPWNHHYARLGMTVPTYLVQAWFGTDPLNYYVAPVTAAVLQVPFLYLIATRIAGRGAGVLAVVMLIEFDGSIRVGSQLLPGVFSGVAILAAVWGLLAYQKAEGRARWGWVLVMGIAAFSAYSVKVTNLFFLPGLVLAMWWGARRTTDVALLGGILLLGLMAETLVLQWLSPHAHRFAIITASHLGGSVAPPTAASEEPFEFLDLLGLLDRFGPFLSRYRTAVAYFFVAAAVGSIAWIRSRRLNSVILVTASFFFFATFLVRSLDPIALFMPMRDRYLAAATPLMLAVNAGFIAFAVGAAARGLPTSVLRSLRGLLVGPAVVAVTAFVVGMLVFKFYARGEERIEARPGASIRHPFLEVPRLQTLYNDTYGRNLPISSALRRGGEKALLLANALYLDPSLLELEGELPPLGSTLTRLNRERVWLSRDPERYLTDARNKDASGGCTVRTHKRSRFALTRSIGVERLPERCVARTTQTVAGSPEAFLGRAIAEPNAVVVFAVRDEGSRKLPEQFVSAMAELGSRIGDLAFRGGYVAVLKNGELVAEVLGPDGEAALELKPDGRYLGPGVRAASEGFNAGRRAVITIDGEHHSLDMRGLNVVVYDLDRRAVRYGMNVDTFSGEQAATMMLIAGAPPQIDVAKSPDG